MYIVLHIWGVNSDPIAIMKRKEKALCICKVDLKLCWIRKFQFQFPLRKDMELKSINLKDLPVSLNASIVVAVNLSGNWIWVCSALLTSTEGLSIIVE